MYSFELPSGTAQLSGFDTDEMVLADERLRIHQ